MDIFIRLLQESDLTTAERIFRLAFGTFTGLPYPDQFGGDANYNPTPLLGQTNGGFRCFCG